MARKYFQMKTSEFNTIWAKALKGEKDWTFFVNAVWDKFSKTTANEEWLKQEYPKVKSWSQADIMGLMSERCYSKCSNVRSSFKSKTNKANFPPFVNGYENRPGAGGKGGTSIDWEEEADKFPG